MDEEDPNELQKTFYRDYLPHQTRIDSLNLLASKDVEWANQLICQCCCASDASLFVQCISQPWITLDTLLFCLPLFFRTDYERIAISIVNQSILSGTHINYLRMCIKLYLDNLHLQDADFLMSQFVSNSKLSVQVWITIKLMLKQFPIRRQKDYCKIMYNKHLDVDTRIHLVHFVSQQFRFTKHTRTLNQIHDAIINKTLFNISLAMEFVYLYHHHHELLPQLVNSFFMYNQLGYFKTLIMYQNKLLDGKAMESLTILRNIDLKSYINYLSVHLLAQFEICANVRDRILYSQQIIHLLPDHKHNILRRLEDIVTDTEHDENTRADACDIIIHYSPARGYSLLNTLRESTSLYKDNQNVHNFIVDFGVREAVKRLTATPPTLTFEKVISQIEQHAHLSKVDMMTLNSIYGALQRIQADSMIYNQVMMDVVLIRVWEEVTQSEHKDELVRIMLDELSEMTGTCSSGHIARLVNIFTGYSERYGIEVHWKDTMREYISNEIKKYADDYPDIIIEMVDNVSTANTELCKTNITQSVIKFYVEDCNIDRQQVMSHLQTILDNTFPT